MTKHNNVLGMNNSDRFFIGLFIVMQRVYCVNDKSTLHIYYETTVNSTKNQKTPILTGGVQFYKYISNYKCMLTEQPLFWYHQEIDRLCVARFL